ncbi:MAG: hypothetical protein KJ955_05770 [Nanoarchaeota archaeon]|nr:hypothetical protein [Nanoarchaeota archaeon]
MIYASLLAADKNNLEKEIDSVEPFVDGFHIDFMDGLFVPENYYDISVVKKTWLRTRKPIEVHLMMHNPEQHFEELVNEGVERVIVHYEIMRNAIERIQMMEEAGKYGINLGIAYNPETHITEALTDYMQIMTVNPGKGGQRFIEEPLGKISSRRYIEKMFPSARKAIFSADGGINAKTAKAAFAAGADIVVAGSYIFKAKDRVRAIGRMRNTGKR